MICIPNERHFERNNQIRYKFYEFKTSHVKLAVEYNLSISQVTKITRAYPPMNIYNATPRWLLLYRLLPAIDALFGMEYEKPLQETK